MNYFKVLDFLQKDSSYIFSVPVDRQKDYLNKWHEPQNDLQRSYFQFRCLHSFFPFWKNFILNFSSYFLLPIAVFYFLIRRLGTKQGEHYEAIIEKKGMPEIVPIELRRKYDIHEECWREGMSLSFKDIVFIVKLVIASRGLLYFVLRSSFILAVYSDMIKRHRPEIIMRHAEYAFSSSLLTHYCHCFGIRHINIQHGEKLFFIRDSFFHFDECYVWDKHYVDLFLSLRAEESQFKISLPPSMQVDVEKYRDEQYFADYKYYLSAYSEDIIKSIVESMFFVKQEGRKLKYRPHPRYSDIDLLKKYVGEEEIEYPQNVSIMQSVSNLEYAVSSYSTVLSQAYFSGKKVILDDVTYKEKFDKLNEMSYILSEKNNCTLSSKQLNR